MSEFNSYYKPDSPEAKCPHTINISNQRFQCKAGTTVHLEHYTNVKGGRDYAGGSPVKVDVVITWRDAE